MKKRGLKTGDLKREGLKKNHKKGLSTIVITLIIILISLVAVGIVWVVVRNVINTGTKEVTLGQFTLDAKIKDVNVYNSSNNVSLTLKRNAGQGEFSKMNFVFSDGRNSEVITVPISLNELEQRSFMFHLSILNVSNLVSISIVPYVKQDNKEVLGNVLDKYTVGGGTSTGIILPVCVPATCGSLGYVCGVWNNGTNCAGSLNCGNCTSGYSCNAFGTCVLGSCTPTTCASQGYVCGNTWLNGTCAGNLNCGGTCGNGSNCVGGRCVNSTQVLHGRDVNENNTGVPAGHTLTNVSSTISVTESWIANSNGGSRILHDLNFLSGAGLNIYVRNVTVQYCKFNGVGGNGAIKTYNNSTGIWIKDTEMDGQNLNLIDDTAIMPDVDIRDGSVGGGINLLRVHIHNWPRALWLGFGNIYIEQCYFHTLTRDGSGAHLENIYMGGGGNVTFLRNKVICDLFIVPGGINSNIAGPLAIYNEDWQPFPALDNILVQDNYFSAGGFNYFGCLNGKGGPQPINMAVTGNVFGREYYRFSGVYGQAAMADSIGFDNTRPGNSWTNNSWGPRGPYWLAGDPEEGIVVVCPGAAG